MGDIYMRLRDDDVIPPHVQGQLRGRWRLKLKYGFSPDHLLNHAQVANMAVREAQLLEDFALNDQKKTIYLAQVANGTWVGALAHVIAWLNSK